MARGLPQASRVCISLAAPQAASVDTSWICMPRWIQQHVFDGDPQAGAEGASSKYRDAQRVLSSGLESMAYVGGHDVDSDARLLQRVLPWCVRRDPPAVVSCRGAFSLANRASSRPGPPQSESALPCTASARPEKKNQRSHQYSLCSRDCNLTDQRLPGRRSGTERSGS